MMVAASAQLTIPGPERSLLGGERTACGLPGYCICLASVIVNREAPFVMADLGDMRTAEGDDAGCLDGNWEARIST